MISVFTGYLALVALRFTAKPKLKITALRLSCGGESGCLIFEKSEVGTLRFKCENVGHWYAKPAATHTTLYINLPVGFEPKEVRYGPLLEFAHSKSGRRSDGGTYTEIQDLHINFRETAWQIQMDVRVPDERRRSRGWVTAYAQEGDCGVHEFGMEVR